MTFEESANEVVATVRDVRTGVTRKIFADYLVGTDGGASLVREHAGITMSGNPALTYTTNVMFRCPGFRHAARQRKGYRHLHRAGGHLADHRRHRRGGDRFPCRSSARPTSPCTPRPTSTPRCGAMSRDFDYQILSVMRWVRRELVADRWNGPRLHRRRRRSPDVADRRLRHEHRHPGLIDLGWKLAARLRGWGGDELLRSYETRQRPVAGPNVTEASGNLGRMLSTRQRRPPPGSFSRARRAAPPAPSMAPGSPKR